MTTVSCLERLVQERASQSNLTVVERLLRELGRVHIRNAHHSGCDCTYCDTLKWYVIYKIRLHHAKRHYHNYGRGWDAVEFYDKHSKEMRALKERLKSENEQLSR